MLNPHSYQPPEDGAPPQEVKLVEVRAEPWPGETRRVHVHLQLTPFLERPDIHVIIEDQDKRPVSSIDIIESIETHMTFTMHLRGTELNDPFTLHASVFYKDHGVVDQKEFTFETGNDPE